MSRLAVLVSGGGSNLQTLIDDPLIKPHIALVLADRPSFALKRAEKASLAHIELSRKRLGKEKLSREVDRILKEKEIDWVILAGYLSIFTESFSEKWKGKIVNIHPSLLPKYGGMGMYGLNVHKAVLDGKEIETGCTVHFVNEGVDTGEIILQAKVPVFGDDTPEVLQKRVLTEEHRLLPRAVKQLLDRN